MNEKIQAAIRPRLLGAATRWPKSLLIPLVLLLVSLLLSLAIVEIGVRLFAPNVREYALPREIFRTDDLLGWRLAQSISAQHQNRYFSAEYQTNVLGYRDPYRNPTSSHSFRMLLFGDSQIFGWGLADEQRFSNRIEIRLPSIEVWNLGVPGYGIDQQILSYQRDASIWSAEAVVFFLSAGTLERAGYQYRFGFRKPIFQTATEAQNSARNAGAAPPRQLVYSLPKWMYTPYFLDRHLARLEQRWRGGPVIVGGELINLVEKILRHGAQLGRERSHKVFVLSNLVGEQDQYFRDLCALLKIGHLTLGLPAEKHLTWGKYDSHWNPEANRLIAQHLGGQLETTTGFSEALAEPLNRTEKLP